jgi:hypothetical protein
LLILLDNTVLSNFAEARLTSVIHDLWKDQINTTSDAISEYRNGVKSAKLPPSAWNFLRVVRLTSEEADFGASLSTKLGRGERSCLAVAYMRNALLASDDLGARRIAARYQIQVTGTVGILVQCVNRAVLTPSQAQQALDQMIAACYYSPVKCLEDL